jgi:hypothetical protein
MEHRATEGFWQAYQALPPQIRSRADKQFALLKANSQYPSLRRARREVKRLGLDPDAIPHRPPK